jgi:hypothetical protein
VITVCFSESGNRPDASEEFTILVIGAAKILRNLFSKGVGSGSRQQDFAGEDRMRFITNSAVTGNSLSKQQLSP